MSNPWQDVIHYPLGPRSKKPRQNGLTMAIDKGLGLNELQDLLETGSGYLDFLKLGFGTSFLYTKEVLQAKINLCHRYQVKIYPGGTLTEIAILQGKFAAFLHRAQELGFDALEISDGTIDLEPKLRKKLIHRALREGCLVFTELGKKDPKKALSMNQLCTQGKEDLASGAYKVIIEARESGKGIGIYDSQGLIIQEKLAEVSQGLGTLADIIWEAPLKTQQSALIISYGSDVNLGNIPTNELISLEALRRGVRNDTLSMITYTPKDYSIRV